ncbi:MAG: hypothetical protein KJN87_00660 [Desulfofustis sp.]|nr:hypothetical protein [Desulfofustis sp.]NNF46556.1 hypothetical protein [Desulfofustis sp.]
MADTQKKMAAALAAVNAYLHVEELAAAEAAAQQVESQTARPVQNLWGLSGRQDMMTMRRLIQLRTFTSFR